MKKYMKQITSWMCALLMTLSMAVPALAASEGPLIVANVTALDTNATIVVGETTTKANFRLQLVNKYPGHSAKIYGVYFIMENSEGDKISLCYYENDGTSTKIFSEDMCTWDITMNGKMYDPDGYKELKEANVLAAIKPGTYTLKTARGIFGDTNKEEFDVSNSNITIEVKNPYAGNNNSTTTPTTSSKPTEDQIGGKYVSADVTTNAGGESTATVAMTDISSQVSANLSADSKAFAKELYNITVKSNYIPANSKIEAGKVLSGAVYTKVASAMSGVDGFRAFEINILNGSNVKVQPTGNGTVYVTVDLPAGYNKNTVDVYRINDDDSTPVKLNIVTRTDSNITFETDHFSTFVIAKNAITESNGSNDDYDDNDDDDTTVVPSQNNNTTTAASSTTAATSANSGTSDTTSMSPKTGDKAPLAALLFVMTCGGAICAVSVKKMIAR